MSKRTCILDFETTGVDPKTCYPLELGYRLYENEPGELFKVTLEYAELINQPNLTEIDPKVTEVNGITLQMIRSKGSHEEACIQRFLNATQNTDYFMSYNISFDAMVMARSVQGFIKNNMKNRIEHPIMNMDNWICGMEDVPYPKKYRCKILSHMAFEHGVFPTSGQHLHRAMGDVDILERLLNDGKYTLYKILEYKNTPWVYMRALVVPPWEDGGESTKEAKKAGFSYETAKGTDSPRFEKTWVKRIKESDLAAERKIELPFKRLMIQT